MRGESLRVDDAQRWICGAVDGSPQQPRDPEIRSAIDVTSLACFVQRLTPPNLIRAPNLERHTDLLRELFRARGKGS